MSYARILSVPLICAASAAFAQDSCTYDMAALEECFAEVSYGQDLIDARKMLGVAVSEQSQINYQMMSIGVRQLLLECSDDKEATLQRLTNAYQEKRAFQAASTEAMKERTELLARNVTACHDRLSRDVLREAIDRSMRN